MAEREQPMPPLGDAHASSSDVPGREPTAALPDADGLGPFKEDLRRRFPTPEAIFAQADKRRRTRRAAGSAIAVAVLSAGLWWADPAYRHERFATAVGERAHHLLADGSRLALNTGTSMSVSWHLRSRQLRLDRGEALFEVAHGSRDFLVHADDTTIRDIGTVFNVRLDAPAINVTVIEGAVEVRTRTAATVIEAGRTARVEGQGLDVSTAADPSRVVAWERGKLVFDGTPLRAAIGEMQRYRSKPIVLADARLASLRLSGEFDVENVDALLHLLPDILPVTLRRTADGTITLSAKNM